MLQVVDRETEEITYERTTSPITHSEQNILIEILEKRYVEFRIDQDSIWLDIKRYPDYNSLFLLDTELFTEMEEKFNIPVPKRWRYD